MAFSVLQFEIKDQVAVVTMNNPPVNALTPAFLDDFQEILTRIKTQTGSPAGAGEKVRSVLLASDCPGFFSAGDDVTKLKEIDDALIRLLPRVHDVLNTFEALPVPTVAAINGHALGGGLELALTCDFRFMGRDSGRIGLPEVRLGMIPAFGGTQRLPLTVGRTRAVEMMVKGLQITPEEAKQIDLINDIYPQESLYDASLDYARRLSRQATGAIGKIKRAVRAGLYGGFERGLAAEQVAFEENIFSDDAKEGIDAFLSGRKPEFKG